jgi:glyoxylase-like metal-dependent hydrolase (beta-lactamase superfamily II)
MIAIVLGLLLLLSGCAAPEQISGAAPAKSLIDEAAAAMGGWPALEGLKRQQIFTNGNDWEPMQATEFQGVPRIVNKFGQATIVDFEKNRVRILFDAYRGYPDIQRIKFSETIDGDAGMLETFKDDGTSQRERLHPAVLVTRLRDVRRLPGRVLLTAKGASDLMQAPDKTEGRSIINVLHYKDAGQAVELQIDSVSKLPLRVIYTEDDPVYGDTLNEVAFLSWRDYTGIRLPETMATFLNGNKIREEHVTAIINNPKFDETSLTIPPDIRSLPEAGEHIVSQWPLRRAVMGVGYQDFGRAQKVDIVELAPGVYHVKGSTHHSLAVEMKDYVVVVEAPLFEERSLAVMKAIESKIPGKPVKYVVMTHFHNDHSGGIRAYAAKGATIIAQEENMSFLKTLLSAPKTVRPDALARAGNRTPAIESVKDVKVITDGARTIELRAIDNPHSAGMLVAYLPKEKILFVSDLFTPGTPVEPSNGNAIENADALFHGLKAAELQVDRIAGGHGAVAPLSDLEKAAVMPKPAPVSIQ